MALHLCLLGSTAIDQQPDPEPAPVFFFAQYGDLDHLYQSHVGSLDLWATSIQQTPTCMASLLLHGDTDNPNPDSWQENPFILSGYPPFDAGAVTYAVLRLDVHYRREEFSYYGSLRVIRYDSCQDVIGLLTIFESLQAHLDKLNINREQWITINIDLVDGRLFAHEADGFGRPIAGKDYGSFGSMTAEHRRGILDAAKDGRLFGIVKTKCLLSYVSLVGRARSGAPRATQTAPTK